MGSLYLYLFTPGKSLFLKSKPLGCVKKKITAAIRVIPSTAHSVTTLNKLNKAEQADPHSPSPGKTVIKQK